MAIVDDYAGIAVELRRLRGEREQPQDQPQRAGKAVAVHVNARRAANRHPAPIAIEAHPDPAATCDRSAAMSLELEGTERAALIRPVAGEVENTSLPLHRARGRTEPRMVARRGSRTPITHKAG